MLNHTPISILLSAQSGRSGFSSFLVYMGAMPHVKVTTSNESFTSIPSGFDVLVTVGQERWSEAATVEIEQFVATGGVWLHCLEACETEVPAIFGVRPGPVGPRTELRVEWADSSHPMAARLPESIYLLNPQRALETRADGVIPLLEIDWRFTRQVVMTSRAVGEGQAICTTLTALDVQEFQHIVYRVFSYHTGTIESKSLGVGILGFAPSVGRLHGLGANDTAGLRFTAVCDLSPERRAAAAKDFPDIRLYESGKALADDPDVDLVIVATPPNTHAAICVEMLSAGKHVVCEKPLALNRKETDRMVETADRFGVHLSCHQNRRFDEDYLMIGKIVRANRIGELFYLETFVGGFGHPCPHWHSHAPISGGTTYDWGAHYLDWIVGLMPEPVATVTATRHNRVWHDVTNADQERIQIRFAGGKEAEFIHSDIAAIRKPKWYLLGTEGAIVGEWRDTIVYRSDPDIYFQWDEIPPTEMVPRLTIYRRRPSGDIEQIEPAMLGSHAPTFLPEQRPVRYPFHQNLADHLLTGEPLAAPLADSVKVVAILEAAARSMHNDGRLERFDG
jgi:scyllo-inositol 2-dehydrogenase (NADP+)